MGLGTQQANAGTDERTPATAYDEDTWKRKARKERDLLLTACKLPKFRTISTRITTNSPFVENLHPSAKFLSSPDNSAVYLALSLAPRLAKIYNILYVGRYVGGHVAH
jgi:hypothetical protein